MPRKPLIASTLKKVDQIVTGRLYDEANKPICDALVEAEGANDADIDLSKRNGRYALQLARGDYTATARKSGFDSPPTKTLLLPPSLLGFDWTMSPALPQPPTPTPTHVFLPITLR
jgi:hypothetical protein